MKTSEFSWKRFLNGGPVFLYKDTGVHKDQPMFFDGLDIDYNNRNIYMKIDFGSIKPYRWNIAGMADDFKMLEDETESDISGEMQSEPKEMIKYWYSWKLKGDDEKDSQISTGRISTSTSHVEEVKKEEKADDIMSITKDFCR